MAPHPSSPELVAPPESPFDPELVSLPRPPRQERTLSLFLMAATGAFALFMTAALFGDVRFALSRSEPDDVGDLSHFVPDPSYENRFARATGALHMAAAIRYERPLERDAFQLVPIAGNHAIWIEMRLVPGAAASGYVPPTAFVGRLLPIGSAAFEYRGLGRRMQEAAGPAVPERAWVLVDGATPQTSRWVVALAALFAMFALYNLVTIARIVRPIRK